MLTHDLPWLSNAIRTRWGGTTDNQKHLAVKAKRHKQIEVKNMADGDLKIEYPH